MLVPYSEAFVLHETRITDLDQMARHLNPLELDDFHQHRKNVISWVEDSIGDKYLANKLRNTHDRDKFVELLFLRQDHIKAKNFKVIDKKDVNKAQLDQVTDKLTQIKVDEELEPTTEIKRSVQNRRMPKRKQLFHFDYMDFKELIDQAAHCVKEKHFDDALRIYGKLKEEFDKSTLSATEKKRLHRKISTIFEMIEHSLR